MMNWYLTVMQLAAQLMAVIILIQPSAVMPFDVKIEPSTIIMTKTNFYVSVNSSSAIPTRYKYSFGIWEFETIQKRVRYSFSRPGKYIIKVSVMFNSIWSGWKLKEILVFDQKAVMASNCTASIDFIAQNNKTRNDVSQESVLVLQVVILLKQCYGKCWVTFEDVKADAIGKNEDSNLELTSYGKDEEHFTNVSLSPCMSKIVHLKIVTPKEMIQHSREVPTAYLPPCNTTTALNPTAITTVEKPDLTKATYIKLNTVVAVFFLFLFTIYIADCIIAYRGHKHLLKPVLNLTKKEDEYMYEVRIHVGNGLSIKSTNCIIYFTLYGTLDVIGPLRLPATSFEDDGIVSFLTSTSNKLGDVSTIGIFCKKMDLTSDWYLRKVEVLKHSEKPDGDHWSDKDIIKRLAKFECHTWFSPASNTHSISQVFHQSTQRLQRSFLFDYLSRCRQLFLQKHILTSWRCSYGLHSFSKIQRLTFLFTFWLVLILFSTLQFRFDGRNSTTQIIHIGLIRLNKTTILFALVSATSTYLVGAVVSTVARLMCKRPQNAYSNDKNFRPLHIDVVRSEVLSKKDPMPSTKVNAANQSNKLDNENIQLAIPNGEAKITGNGTPSGVEHFVINIERSNSSKTNACDDAYSEPLNRYIGTPESYPELDVLPNNTWKENDTSRDNPGYIEEESCNNLNACEQNTTSNILDLDAVALDIEDENFVNCNSVIDFEKRTNEMKSAGKNSRSLEGYAVNNMSYHPNGLTELSVPEDVDDGDCWREESQGDQNLTAERQLRYYLPSDANYEDKQTNSEVGFFPTEISENKSLGSRDGDLCVKAPVKKVSFALPQDEEDEDDGGDGYSRGEHPGSDHTGISSSTPLESYSTEKEMHENNNTINGTNVQFLNRETLPTTKQNPIKVCLLRTFIHTYWIFHIILIVFTVVFSLTTSKNWSNDTAYSWLSMSTLGMAVICFLIDTLRVMLYVFLITLKERKSLALKEKRTTFKRHCEQIYALKRAEAERELFFQEEFPEDRWKIVKDHYRLKSKVNDFLIFALFVFVLLVLTKWVMSDRSFRFWHSLADFLFNFQELTSIQSNGLSVDPVENFWKWLSTTLPLILIDKMRDSSMHQLHVMSQTVHLIQKRVLRGQCDVKTELRKLITECNVGYDKDYEDRSSYQKGWIIDRNASASQDSPWKYQHNFAFEHRSPELRSTHSYLLDGYVATFNASNIQSTINDLKKYRWVDKYTRLLYFELYVYDPSVNLLSPVIIALEFTPSSYILINGEFFNFVLFPNLSTEHEFVQFAELAFFVMTFYFIYDVFKRKHRMSTTWCSGWLLTEAIMIVLSLVVIILMAIKNFYVYKLTVDPLYRGWKAEIAHKVAFYQNVLEHVLATLNLLSIALLMKPVFTLGLFDDMYLAVVKTMMQMSGIALETIIIMIAFTLWAHAAFVGNISTFSKLSKSFPTLMDMLVRPDNEDLYEIPFFGPLILLVYFCIMILLISNIFISAIQQSYSEARHSLDGIQRGSVLKYVMKSLNKKASRRLLKRSMAKKPGVSKSDTNGADFKTIIGSRTQKLKRYRRTNKQASRRQADARMFGDNTHNDRNNARRSTMKKSIEQHDNLELAVKRLENFINTRIRNENAEDKVLVATISDNWKKFVEKKPPMTVISLYKKYRKDAIESR